MDQNELPFDPRHLGGPSSATKISMLVVRHKPCTYFNTFSKQTEASFCNRTDQLYEIK
jgi:hypothetical protein